MMMMKFLFAASILFGMPVALKAQQQQKGRPGLGGTDNRASLRNENRDIDRNLKGSSKGSSKGSKGADSKDDSKKMQAAFGGTECTQTTKRVRKDFRSLTADERELFYKALNTAKKRGLYDKFVDVHGLPTNNIAAHMTAQFFAWHRKFLLEFENMLRSLGEEFRCITVPYWDWAADGQMCQYLHTRRPVINLTNQYTGKKEMIVLDCLDYRGPMTLKNPGEANPIFEPTEWGPHRHLTDKEAPFGNITAKEMQEAFGDSPFQAIRSFGGPGSPDCSTTPFCIYEEFMVSKLGSPACSKDNPDWGPVPANSCNDVPIVTREGAEPTEEEKQYRTLKGFSIAGGSNAIGCVTKGPFAGWMTPSPTGESNRNTCLSRATNFTINPDVLANINGTYDIVELIALRRKWGPNWGSTGSAQSTLHSIFPGANVVNENYAGFRLAAEMKPHIQVHALHGGHMISYESTSDPIFWLHHSFMDRLWALWQDCHDFECPDCYQRNGAYDGYTYIETGRYWWNKNAAAWHEPTPRSIAENSKAAIVDGYGTGTYLTPWEDWYGLPPNGAYFEDQSIPPIDTADPLYAPNRTGVIQDTIDAPMRFYYPEQKTHCFLGPEFDYKDPDGCYACIISVRPDCRSSWIPGNGAGQTPVHNDPKPMQGGMVPIEDYCLFICGYPQCEKKCGVIHHPTEETSRISNSQVPTWNNERRFVTDYWAMDRLPVTVEQNGEWIDSGDTKYAVVQYESNELSDELLDTAICHMNYTYPDDFDSDGNRLASSSDNNPFVGDFVYRCLRNTVLISDSMDSLVMGYGVFRLKADGPNKIKGTLEGGNIGAILEVTGNFTESTSYPGQYYLEMVAKVENWGGVRLNNWEYHYKAHLMPDFTNAVTTLHHSNYDRVVGTCIRWIDGHDGGRIHPQGESGAFWLSKI